MAKVIPSSLPVIGSEMPRGQFGPAGLEERIARGLGVACLIFLGGVLKQSPLSPWKRMRMHGAMEGVLEKSGKPWDNANTEHQMGPQKKPGSLIVSVTFCWSQLQSLPAFDL